MQVEVAGGSFRGAQFFVESHDFGSGRRKVDHEFPKRDISRSEDLGRKIRSFSINCFVLGDDYFDKRNALLEALEKDGPGTLVHPYLGVKLVQAGEFSLRETVREGRVARFTVEFTETPGEPRFPAKVVDNKQSTIASADSVIDESKSFFETVFDVANQPAQVLNSASAGLDSALDFLNDSVNKFTQPIDNVSRAISEAKAAKEALIRAPGVLADRIADTFNLLFEELFGSPETASLILGNFSNFSLPPAFDDSTPSRAKANANNRALENFFKQQSHSNQAKSAVEIDFPNTREAIELRDEIKDEFDIQLGREIGDDLFQSIQDLQSSITRTLPSPSTGTLIEFRPPKTLPVIVIAYSLFRSLDKEEEIIKENLIKHPGFAPGLVPIEVSSG